MYSNFFMCVGLYSRKNTILSLYHLTFMSMSISCEVGVPARNFLTVQVALLGRTLTFEIFFITSSEKLQQSNIQKPKTSRNGKERGNPTKWSNTLKQFVGFCRRVFLRVFDHFVVLARKRILEVNLHKNKYRFAIHR